MEIFIEREEELRGDKIKDARKTKGYYAQDEVPPEQEAQPGTQETFQQTHSS